jgi:NDP-sugar pyrophosphorylase family protein
VGDGVTTDARAVLQAGGRGDRLRPLTDTIPKPLLAVAGVPMVERLVRQLAAAGVRSITVAVNWLGQKVIDHLAAIDDLPDAVEIAFIEESRPMGNVGALAGLPPWEGPTLLAFADLVTDLDFRTLLEVHRRGGAAATLATHEEVVRVRLGEVVAEGDRVVAYREKPLKAVLIGSGIAVFEPAALRLLPSEPAGISDLVNLVLEADMVVRHWRHGAEWMDVNSLDDLDQIQKRFSDRPATPTA